MHYCSWRVLHFTCPSQLYAGFFYETVLGKTVFTESFSVSTLMFTPDTDYALPVDYFFFFPRSLYSAWNCTECERASWKLKLDWVEGTDLKKRLEESVYTSVHLNWSQLSIHNSKVTANKVTAFQGVQMCEVNSICVCLGCAQYCPLRCGHLMCSCNYSEVCCYLCYRGDSI